MVDQEFISAGVNAYALGCTDEGLRKELIDMKESGVEIEAMESYGGSTSLKSKIASGEVSRTFLVELERFVDIVLLFIIYRIVSLSMVVNVKFVASFF